MTKACPQCGSPHNRRRFCSDLCRRAYWKENPQDRKMYPKICRGCGAWFYASRENREYHSLPCRNRATARVYVADLKKIKPTIVWSCGGGVDSTAIAVLILRGNIPKPDMVLMTDVGWEPETTWNHVKGVLMPAMERAGIPFHLIRTEDYCDPVLFDPQGRLTIPAYRYDEDGNIVRLRTFCSGQWKLQVGRRWMRAQGIERCVNWIGIAADEKQRVRQSGLFWLENAYPLAGSVDPDVELTRDECLDLIEAHGWPEPPRTSCVMCPQKDRAGWRFLQKHSPMDWERAVMIDEYIRGLMPGTYLHRSMAPLRNIESKTKQLTAKYIGIDKCAICHE